ncbi:MAG: chromate transporter [Burkholderiaceae bacterium]|nr:chromate transporter [Burkholderiaceae bacterium]
MIALSLQASDWLGLLLYFLSMSLLAVGGAISLAPDMHRFLVDQQGWLTDLQFNASIAIAQAAPGPNLLFIALLGWNVGLNAAGAGAGSAGWALGLLGAGLTMLGILLPSATLTWLATRWAQRNRERRSVRVFKQGMAPIVIGFMMATAWVLGRGQGQIQTDLGLWLLGLACALLVWRTRLHLLWLLGAGAALGALGWV